MDILKIVKEKLHCTDTNCAKCEFGICTDKQGNSGVTVYNFVCSKWTDDMWDEITDELPLPKFYCPPELSQTRVTKCN